MARTTGNAKDLITFTRASTGTFLGSNGLLQTAAINTPRVEYDANGVAKGLLIEEQRTNLVTYSEDFTVSAWIKGNSSIENVSGVTPPDGSTSANKLIWDNGATTFGSVRLAAADRGTATNPIVLYTLSGSGSFTITSGAGVPTIEKVGDWYRCSLKDDSSNETMSVWARPAGFDRIQLQFYGNSRYIYVRDSVATQGDGTSGVYIWGAQLEAGSFPTSYIPTSGATATRSADLASVSVSEFGYNNAQGTFVVEFQTPDSSDADVVDLGGSGKRYLIRNGLAFYLTPAGTQVAINYGSSANNQRVAFAVQTNDAVAAVNGAIVGTDTTVTLFSDPTILEIGGLAGVSSVEKLNGHVKSINYYPLRLSDAKLQSLTS